MDLYWGAALSHTNIDNRFQGASDSFTSSASGVGVWIDFVAAYHLSNTLSLQTSIERNVAEDDSGNLAFYLRFQPLKSVYIDAGHYRFIYDSGTDQQVSYEKKSCDKPSEPCDLPYTGDISQVKQTLRGLGISLGYKF